MKFKLIEMINYIIYLYKTKFQGSLWFHSHNTAKRLFTTVHVGNCLHRNVHSE